MCRPWSVVRGPWSVSIDSHVCIYYYVNTVQYHFAKKVGSEMYDIVVVAELKMNCRNLIRGFLEFSREMGRKK